MKSVIYILADRPYSATMYAKLMGFDLRRCAAITHPVQMRGVPASQIIVLGPLKRGHLFDGIPLEIYLNERHSVAYDYNWGRGPKPAGA